MSPEREDKLQEREKPSDRKELKRSWLHFSISLPLHVQFAVKASREMKAPAWSWEANTLEKTLCWVCGGKKAQGWLFLVAQECGGSAIHNPSLLLPFSIAT